MRVALLVVVGVALLGIGVAIDPARAERSWHWVWLWSTGISLGALMLLLVSHLAPIGWLAGLRRPLVGLATAQIVLAPGFLVLAIGHPSAAAVARGGVALVVAAGIVACSWWITRRDDPGSVWWLQRLGAVGVPLIAIGWTALAVDFGMGVSEEWISHAVGVRWFAQGTLGALAATLLLAIVGERTDRLPPLPDAFVSVHGRLLLGFVLFWVYALYCELFIPWIVDSPKHVPYLDARLDGSGGVLMRILWIAGLGVPLAVLLSRRLKRHRPTMLVLSAWIVGVTALDAIWLIVPTTEPEVSPAGMGALLLCGTLLGALGYRATDPADPLLSATVGYEREVP